MHDLDSELARAVCIAARAHEDQREKNGGPYILHPLRLMLRLQDTQDRIAAVLHDVIEDSDWTLEDLRREGISERSLAAVELLTHRPGDSYETYVQRLSTDPIARRVKLQDLQDNMNLTRLPAMTDRAHRRIDRYFKAWMLLKELDSSDAGSDT